MSATETGDRRQAPGDRRQAGQAYLYIALALPVLCGMLALAVDVGTTTARYQALQHQADNAARAGAYTLYGRRIGANTASDRDVWTSMVSKLTAAGLTVVTPYGGALPRDPCAVGYQQSQVAMAAVYLDSTDNVIMAAGNTPWTVGSGSIPPPAWGVKVTLGTCQAAGFGGVVGHPSYTMWVNGWSGHWQQGPVPSLPYAASAAPNGNCNDINASDNYTPTVPLPGGGHGSPDNNDPEEFYCKNVYTIGSSVTFYANGRGLGNDYGHDANFKGYIGSSGAIGQQGQVSTGGGNNGPSPCPATGSLISVSIISGVNHSGNTDYFVVLETIVVKVTACANNMATGTMVSVDDPNGYGVVSVPATPPPPPPV